MAGSTFRAAKSKAIVRAAFPAAVRRLGEATAARARAECPRRTGRLADSIECQVDPGRDRARVGTNLLYGRFVVLGTRRMAPDDFLTRAMLALAAAGEYARIASGR